ncbi:MAG: hypothetical protein M3342_06850 [Bacteroidota bacterium]|nr:hypothetical protein [Flavisolibacter sp.]MDQ3843719.1 hypothetical protein [Bacteroidota bacterium]MBD0287759.1 hypothetical protein [Flavisolibacter sp.]MBD0297958.1 hypothetical protein [Flavisolibacter sp.]MBD0352075.1 hypothetical protein [Flavisolibacter sp.]
MRNKKVGSGRLITGINLLQAQAFPSSFRQTTRSVWHMYVSNTSKPFVGDERFLSLRLLRMSTAFRQRRFIVA